MSLHKAIPTRAVNGFKFLREIDFYEYRKRLPAFFGQPADGEPESEAIPRIVGFIHELMEAQEILASSLTNSVYIRGPEGVGKSMLILSLLNKMALGEAAPSLVSKHCFGFDLHEFFKLSVADQVREFDAAMDYLARKNSLIVLDRLDDLLANCGPERARRLMSTLIDALENERVCAIASAQDHNHGLIEQTSTAFAHHFKELTVYERGAEETRAILRQMVPRLEAGHLVIIGDDVINEVMRLDQRYEGRLKGRNPTRVIEFLDQLAASVNIAKYGKPLPLLEQEMALVKLIAEAETLRMSVRPSARRLDAIRTAITSARVMIEPQLKAWEGKFGPVLALRSDLLEAGKALAPLQERYEAYAAWKDQHAEGEPAPAPLTVEEMHKRDVYLKAEKTLRASLAELEQGVYAETPHVTVADVQERFSKITGVSAKSVSTDDAERLLRVEEVLGQTVYGQDHAKRAIANIYRTREAGTSDPTRPAGVLFLTGAPGCGKTELVEKLAAYDGSPPITYNMSLYTDASSVSRLLGAAPGLVGFGQVVTLPDAVREKPRSIVFFDEIEKAHPDLQRTLMQVMDKGVMPDSQNLPVSFKDCILVFASNVLKQSDFADGEDRGDEKVRARLAAVENPKSGKPLFLPEFVGRIDDVELFDDVTTAIAELILDKELSDINRGIAGRGYEVCPESTETLKAIVAAFFNPSQGGRSIRQLSKNVLRPLVTERLLHSQVANTGGDEDELKPLILQFSSAVVRIDGQALTA
ncbi:AAA family ATPase [Labrys sp. 22185]|uniref:AAA family ATPase n=1 Tax=Labrys sp. 22185 TaxID=3453888 RepID=UPI003F83BA3A